MALESVVLWAPTLSEQPAVRGADTKFGKTAHWNGASRSSADVEATCHVVQYTHSHGANIHAPKQNKNTPGDASFNTKQKGRV